MFVHYYARHAEQGEPDGAACRAVPGTGVGTARAAVVPRPVRGLVAGARLPAGGGVGAAAARRQVGRALHRRALDGGAARLGGRTDPAHRRPAHRRAGGTPSSPPPLPTRRATPYSTGLPAPAAFPRLPTNIFAPTRRRTTSGRS